MELKIGVIKGDGIGPEIVDEALKVLDRVGKVYGHTFSYTQLLMGGASIDVNGVPLTEETLNLAKESDAVLMGSIGETQRHPLGISWNRQNGRKQDFLLCERV